MMESDKANDHFSVAMVGCPFKLITRAQGLAVEATTMPSSLTLLPCAVGKLPGDIYYTQKASKSIYEARGLD